METKIVNSAAGTVISNHGRPIPPRRMAQYQVSLAVLHTMLRRGDLSEKDHVTACDLLACHYGLDQNSIFR